MPKVLTAFEFKASTVGHSQYDWDTLLDGKIYHLESGVDFECKPDTMTMLIRKNARKKSVGVKVTKVENDGIVIQATGHKDYPAPKKKGEKAADEGSEGEAEAPPAAPAKPTAPAAKPTPPAAPKAGAAAKPQAGKPKAK